jgi:hypothetical protein
MNALFLAALLCAPARAAVVEPVEAAVPRLAPAVALPLATPMAAPLSALPAAPALSAPAAVFAAPSAAEAPRPAAAPSDYAERARALDRGFDAEALWGEVGPAVRAEIEALRARRLPKAAVKERVRAETNASFERIKAARGVTNLALHYNLHGGRREDYVARGIRASKGDIALRYTTSGDWNEKVYFFQSAHHDAYTALDASNGEILFWPTRMGHVLMAFDLDHPQLAAARADGRISDGGAISMNFHKGMRGVPYPAFLAPPVHVFVKTAKKVGLRRLSRDEETLAVARFLEAALTRGAAFVPAR